MFPKIKTCLDTGILEFWIQKCGFYMRILSQILKFSKLLFGFIFEGISIKKMPKFLKVPSFARSVLNHLKVHSLASSVPMPLLIEPRCRPPPPAVKERSD